MTSMARVTEKQKSFLEFIYKYTIEHGYAPTQQEIANFFGWSSLGTVQDYVKKLVKKKFLKEEREGDVLWKFVRVLRKCLNRNTKK